MSCPRCGALNSPINTSIETDEDGRQALVAGATESVRQQARDLIAAVRALAETAAQANDVADLIEAKAPQWRAVADWVRSQPGPAVGIVGTLLTLLIFLTQQLEYAAASAPQVTPQLVHELVEQIQRDEELTMPPRNTSPPPQAPDQTGRSFRASEPGAPPSP
jgi:hypothetical protein